MYIYVYLYTPHSVIPGLIIISEWSPASTYGQLRGCSNDFSLILYLDDFPVGRLACNQRRLPLTPLITSVFTRKPYLARTHTYVDFIKILILYLILLL